MWKNLLSGCAVVILFTGPSEAKIATINLAGTGVWSSASGIYSKLLGQTVQIDATLSFSDGSNQFGDPELPSDFSGIVNFQWLASGCGSSGYNQFSFNGGRNCTGGVQGPNQGSVELFFGQLRRIEIFAFASPDGAFISNNKFVIYDDRGRGSSAVAYFTRTSPVFSPVPEPNSWAMLIAGFGLIGRSMRRRQASLVVD